MMTEDERRALLDAAQAKAAKSAVEAEQACAAAVGPLTAKYEADLTIPHTAFAVRIEEIRRIVEEEKREIHRAFYRSHPELNAPPELFAVK